MASKSAIERAKRTRAETTNYRPPLDPVYTEADLLEQAPTLVNRVDTLKAIYDIPDGAYPLGSVSAYSFGGAQSAGKSSSFALPTAQAVSQGVGGNAEFWLRPKNKAYGAGSRIELMPARRSFTPVQGQSVPGAGAGLEIKVKSNIAKLPIPGSRPVIQHMGIAEETICFVGAFCGFDIPENDPSEPDVSWLSYGRKRVGNAYDEAMNLLEGIRAGWELELVMRWNSRGESYESDIAIEYAPQIRYTGYVKHFVKEFATAQRVYYKIEIIINNRETTILKDPVDAPSLGPSSIAGGIGGLNIIAATPDTTEAPLSLPSTGSALTKQGALQIQRARVPVTLGSAKGDAAEIADAVNEATARKDGVFYSSTEIPYVVPLAGVTVNSVTVQLVNGGNIKSANGRPVTKIVYHPNSQLADLYLSSNKIESTAMPTFFSTYPEAQKLYSKSISGGKNQ